MGNETCYFRIVNQVLLRRSSFWLLTIFLPLIRLLTVFLQFCGSRERAVIRLQYTHSMHVLFYYYYNFSWGEGPKKIKKKKKKKGAVREATYTYSYIWTSYSFLLWSHTFVDTNRKLILVAATVSVFSLMVNRTRDWIIFVRLLTQNNFEFWIS